MIQLKSIKLFVVCSVVCFCLQSFWLVVTPILSYILRGETAQQKDQDVELSELLNFYVPMHMYLFNLKKNFDEH